MHKQAQVSTIMRGTFNRLRLLHLHHEPLRVVSCRHGALPDHDNRAEVRKSKIDALPAVEMNVIRCHCLTTDQPAIAPIAPLSTVLLA